MEVTVTAPNHSGDPLGSILGPMGPHSVKKGVKTVKNYHVSKFEFSTTLQSSFLPKKWKLRLWRQITVGNPRVHLGANGVPLGKKMGQNRKNHHAQKFEFSTTHWFFWKNGSYGSGAKSRWGPLRVHLGVNGSKKWVKTVKITMPQNSNFRLPSGHRFFAKNGSYIYSAKSRSGLPRVHLGANGVPLGPKMGQNGKITMPQNWIFDDPSVIGFSQKMEVTVMAPNHGGDLLRSILGPMGSDWVKKWSKP